MIMELTLLMINDDASLYRPSEAVSQACASPAKSLSNVSMVNEKFVSFYQKLKFYDESGSTVFSIPRAIICAGLNFISIRFSEVGLFKYVIYS